MTVDPSEREGEIAARLAAAHVTGPYPVSRADLEWLLAEVGRLREALVRYGAHDHKCQRGPDCTCGFAALAPSPIEGES